MGCGTSSESVENVIIPSQDRYERKQLIGVGHHGRVYRSFYHSDHHEYAQKVIDQLQNPTVFQQTRKSWGEIAKQLTNLNNAYVVAYKQIDFNQREITVIMDIAKQGTLRKYVQKNSKLTEQKAANMIQSILQGVLYLHNIGIFHKDLKTNNILLFGDLIKLSDYMLAELYDVRLSELNNNEKDKATFIRGDSLPFMAPQVIRNKGFTQKADIWSIGCVLIEMLTGKTPWSNLGGTFQQAFKKISAGVHPPFPSNLSKDCENFLSSCLAISPHQRLTIKELLKHKYIRSFSKNTLSEPEVDNIKIKIEKTDKANRVDSRKKYEQNLKSPVSIEQVGQVNENNYNITTVPRKFIARRDANSSKKAQQQYSSTDQRLIKLKEVVHSLSNLGNNSALLDKQDILPEIMEDQQEMVMLNNKKVPREATKKNKKVKTEQPDLKNEEKRFERSDFIQSESNNIKNSNANFRIKTKNNVASDSSQEHSGLNNNRRIDTEPLIEISQFELQNKDFFKRPLKLLKKKIQERKISGKGFNNGATSENSQSFTNTELMKAYVDEEDNEQRRNRSITESSREETVINTQLARAERDRYINQQLSIKKQREEEKKKWEQELKKDGDMIKKQFSHRYGQPHAYLIASLQK